MEKKTYEEDSDNDEFESDKPGELASAKGAKKRKSTVSKRPKTSKKKKISSEDEDDEDCKSKQKRYVMVKTRSNKDKSTAKGQSKNDDEEDDSNEELGNDSEVECEEVKVVIRRVEFEEIIEGDFLISRTADFSTEKNPPIYRVGHKVVPILRKYIHYEKEGQIMFYKSTNEYEPINSFYEDNEFMYWPITVIDHEPRTTPEVHVVQCQRGIFPKEDSSSSE